MITPQEVGQLNELFALARISKRLFLESSEKFLEKPTICFQFLQQEGLLPKPLTPSIAAIFLRQNTFLDKTAVGAFLGELGKDKNNNLKHECESVEFHQQLLQCYVKSFSFSSLSVLNSLRLFLSAFRLPGEAQQIDRILVAFSEYVHHHCYENRSEIIENPEITYLLSFSIIMLNTDRHNPNIRPEKKMTLDQFIKNNTNYGRDVNQTKPLPKEYLEEIYDSISKHPIRTTHGSEVFALVTDEEWMDVNMMLKTNPYYSLLLSSRQNPLFINQLLAKTLNQENDEVSDEIGEGGRAGGALSSNTSTRSDDSTTASMFERYAILKDLFTSPLGWYSTLHLSTLFEKIYGLDWLWDRDLLYATSPYLLLPGISVLIYNHIIVEETIYIEQTPDAPPINENHQLFEWKERTGRLMELSTDFLMEILSIASKHGLWKIIDMTTAILLQISGLKDTDIAQTYVKMMSLPNEYLFPPTTSGMIIESDPLQDDDVYPDHCYFIQRISYGTVQKSLLLLLNIIATYYSSMSNWSLLIYPLVILRDFTLLPSELVFLDAEQDNLLPSNVRQEFEFSLVSLDRQEQQQEAMLLAQEQQNLANQKKQAENTRSSFYALQLLGEALFGSSSSTAHSSGKGRYGSADEEDDTIEGTLIRIISDQYNLRSSRWDSGYEPSSNSSYHTTSGAATAPPSTPTAILGQRILQQQNNQRGSLTPRSPDQPFAKTVKWDVNSLRSSIEKTNILGFIAESKFLPDEHLVALLKTIIRTTEAYCSMEVASNSSATAVAAGAGVASGNLGSGKESDRNNNNNDVINDLVDHITLDLSSSSYHHQNVAISNPAYQNILPNTSNHSANSNPKAYAIHYYRNSEHFLDTMHFISNQRIQSYTSAASIAWLEMLLVEIVLRNRDRFHLCWPYLKYHYTRCLGNSFHKLSYITERQLSGLLKISARMLSRDNYGGVLIELLGRIFHPLFRLPPLSLTVTNATAAAAIATPVPPGNTMTSKKNMPLQKAANSNDLEDESHHANSTAALTHQNYLAAIDSLQGLSNQIAAGMWKLFTHNVDLLPMLSLEQWETLFKIVAFGSNAGSFAAFKSFEVMAWLLHEPRLIANVPVFCIIAVKPLVYNKQAPIFVSTGAVKLLKYLHSRLEAIIQDPHKGEGGNDTSASDTALKKEGSQDVMDYEDLLALDETSATVWKKCWLPILHALAEGVADDRVPVRESCAIALCEAINDRHAYAVPPGVLIDVFVHILCPVIRVLGDYLISDLHKQSLHAAINSSVNHLESLGLTAQIVTTAPGLPPPQARGRASSTGSGTGGKGKHDQDWVAVDPTPRPPKASSEEEITPELTSIPSTAPELSAIESHVIMRCIDTLTVVFMKHVRKLSHYPSFDKLWLQFLQLFSYFLEITPTSPPAPSTGAVISQPSAVSSAVGILFPPSNSAANEEYAILIQQLSNVCIQKLEVLIHCLQREKVFAKKEGLWLVTKEFLLQLSLPSSTNSSKNILRLLQESSST